MPDLTGMLSNFGAWLLTLADKDTWGIVGNWFNGFAALAVVFLALSLQAWFEWRRRPKLKIVYDPNDDNDVDLVDFAIIGNDLQKESIYKGNSRL